MDTTPARVRSTEELDRMWISQLRWWHIILGLLVGVTAVGILVAGMSVARTAIILACLAGIVVAYAVAGRYGFARPEEPRTVAYLVLAWVLLLLAISVDTVGISWIMCFVLFPHTWAMSRVTVAIWFTTVVSVALMVIRMWQTDWDPSALPGILIGTFLSWALSIILGLFIVRLVHEAEARATAIDELHDTQAQLAAAERDRGVHEERDRLSREIHDTLAQGFTSVVTLSRAVDAALARGDVATARDRLALLEATAADNLSEARLIVAELTPGHLQSRTLVEALDRLVGAVSAESGVRAALDVAGEPVRLPGSTEVVLLRTAQEALSNVRRHARARSARVVVSYADPARVVLTVRDDGIGYATDAGTGGFGLDGVRSRAADIGGAAEVTSAPGRGTAVRVEVPR
ncbi:sensor histidine kinase [Nostocoides japonicum]|nr:sensor histidine kinase [Tetrasphaera japonica]